MPVCLDSLVIGQKYERSYLAKLWGYESYHAISRGVVTPIGTNLIILFVTKNKQQSLTQYRDCIEGDLLYWEGESKHGSDERIVNAEVSGDRIYLFYRDEHHNPFIYYGEVKLVFYELETAVPSKFIFRIFGTAGNLTQCSCLKESDKYFEGFVSSGMLGDIEPGEGELEYLSGLIASELDKPFVDLQESLSVAVFLVWTGCLHYREGDYWSTVYQKLGLPSGQVKWQSILGECFLKAISKHNLFEFKGKSRYITPILAHGYIPNWYLESYFEDVVLAIYKDRNKPDLQINKSEAEHIVLAWRRDYEGYEECRNLFSQLEQEETRLSNMIQAVRNKETLEKFRELQAKLKDDKELQELLSSPEDWLNNAEAELAVCQERYNALKGRLEQQQKINEARESKAIEINELVKKVEAVASQIFESWEDGFSEQVLALSVSEIEELSEKIEATERVFSGIKGLLLRFFTPSRYRKACKNKQQLAELLQPLPVRQKLLSNPWPNLPKCFYNLQDVVEQLNHAAEILADLDSALQEIAATQEDLFAVDLDEMSVKIEKLTQEIAEYKTNLVKLGRGTLEKGMEKLEEQKRLSQEIAKVRGQIPGDVFTLLAALTEAESNPNIKVIENQLIRVRKQKKDTQEKLRVYRNPLYSLNESARVFIFQGGDKAIEFIYDSLVLIEKLYKGETGWESRLPKRIARAMVQWWDQKGKELLEQTWIKQTLGKEREAGSAHMRKPSIYFDSVNKVIKAVLPPQPVSKQASAQLVIKGNSGRKQEVSVPIKAENKSYRSEAAEVVLENPEPIYNFEFRCGDTFRTWQITGIGWYNFCMLFNSRNELVENGQLPEDGAYIIAPLGSSVEPVGAAQERLHGYWADYGYWYVDLKNTDVVLIKTGEDVTVFKRQVQLQPMFISRNILTGITAGEAIICQGQLPSLLFSVTHPEEMAFYGVQLESAGEVEFRSIEQLTMAVSKNNVVHISLEDSGRGKYGLFTVSLIKRGTPVWSASCAVVPELELVFDKPFYRIQDETRETGQLKLLSGHKIEFYPEKKDNTALSRLSPTQVGFDTRQSSVRGKLIYYTERRIELDVCIDIPNICLRHPGENWRFEVEEIWHEDLGEIEVKIPAIAGDSVKVALEGDKQVITRSVRKGIATFDLRRFSDTLRDSGEVVQELILTCPKIPPFILARVRTRWQALKINLIQRVLKGNRQLFLEWEDRGKTADRVVRFWPLDMPGMDVLEWEIPDGASSVNITFPLETMLPGRYRLHIAAVDPWDNDKVEIPEQGTENCKDVYIGTADEQLQVYVGKQLEITGFYYKGEPVKPETFYWVEVMELDPTFEGEVRLKGNVYSYAIDGTVAEMPYNPVSFYISDNKMPFLIDKDADGAMYCRKCKVMFWEVGHKECGSAVIEPELIIYRVR